MIKKIVYKYRYYLIFILLFVVAFSFLIFNKWIWLYLDLAWWPKNQSENIILLKQIFFSWENSNISFFWYDVFFNNFQRILSVTIIYVFNYLFWSNIWQILFYFLSAIIWFIFTRKLITYLKLNNAYILSLLYVFNPLSVYLISQWSIYITYMVIPMFFYFLFRVFDNLISSNKLRFSYILWLIISNLLLLSYLRIFWIVLLILVFFILINFKIIWIKLKKLNVKKLFIYILIYIFTFVWLFTWFILLKLDKSIVWQSHYIEYQQKRWDKSFYDHYNNQTSFYDEISINQITSNFSQKAKDINLIITFILLIIAMFAFIKWRNNKYEKISINILTLFIIFLSLFYIPKIINIDIFTIIYDKFIPFYSMDILWNKIPLFIFLLLLLGLVKFNKYIKFIIIGIIIISLIPIFWNYKLHTIWNFDNFFSDKIGNKSAIFYPYNNEWFIFRRWYPYPLNPDNNSIYHSILSGNPRLVWNKQIGLSKILYFNPDKSVFLGLKNIFVFKDVENSKPWQFDFFPVKNYVKESKEYYNKFKNNKNLYIKQDNKNFAQFWLKGDDKFEYFLYSPAKILKLSMDDFFKKEINIYEKPVIIDPTSLNKPKKIDNFNIPESNKHIKITYKQSILNPTKIYFKIENFDKIKPFLMQLNQTFWMSWKIKWISKKDFEEKPCIDNYKYYPITENKVCYYKSTLLNIKDTKYLFKPGVRKEHHFEWNFVWNTWLVEPDDLPNNTWKELYWVIIYEKQIYYTWALIISWLTFLILILLSIIQEAKIYLDKRKK